MHYSMVVSLSPRSTAGFFIMSVLLVVSQSRTGNFTLSVKGESKAEVYAVAQRINAWLPKALPAFSPYLRPAYADKVMPSLYYSPVPLCLDKGFVPVEVLSQMLSAMTKAGVQFELAVFCREYAPLLEHQPNEDEAFAQVVVDVPSNLVDISPSSSSIPSLPGKVATNSELKAELRRQGKSVKGNKAQLIARL